MTNPTTQNTRPNLSSNKDIPLSTNRSLGSDAESVDDNNFVLIWAFIVIFIVVAIILGVLLVPGWTVDWHRYRSISAEKRGDYPAAIAQLKILRAMAPGESGADLDNPSKDPTYLSELGYCYMKLEDYKTALDFYQKAQENRTVIPPDEQGNPRPPYDFSASLGVCSLKLGDLAHAHQYLEAALKLNKLDPTANFYMGELLLKENNLIKAADYYKVVAKNPAFEDQVKKRYAEIEQRLFGNIK
jgi:tetratricopeptide (TPR) repeat protein